VGARVGAAAGGGGGPGGSDRRRGRRRAARGARGVSRRGARDAAGWGQGQEGTNQLPHPHRGGAAHARLPPMLGHRAGHMDPAPQALAVRVGQKAAERRRSAPRARSPACRAPARGALRARLQPHAGAAHRSSARRRVQMLHLQRSVRRRLQKLHHVVQLPARSVRSARSGRRRGSGTLPPLGAPGRDRTAARRRIVRTRHPRWPGTRAADCPALSLSRASAVRDRKL